MLLYFLLSPQFEVGFCYDLYYATEIFVKYFTFLKLHGRNRVHIV